MGVIKHVIIGDGAAGIAAATVIREQDPIAEIEIISDDPNAAYYRAALTNYLIGELTENQIWSVPPNFFADLKIRRTHGRVLKILPTRNEIVVSGAASNTHYDSLLIAAGARARELQFPGVELKGVMTMRTMRDIRRVLDTVLDGSVRNSLIVGGGPLGLEWAQGLREKGVQVTLMLRRNKIMAGVLDDTGSDLVLARLKIFWDKNNC